MEIMRLPKMKKLDWQIFRDREELEMCLKVKEIFEREGNWQISWDLVGSNLGELDLQKLWELTGPKLGRMDWQIFMGLD